jgi:hypothetical protein
LLFLLSPPPIQPPLFSGSWLATNQRAGEWLQIDLGKVRPVGGIATQGRQGTSQFTTRYFVRYAKVGNDWRTYEENKKARIFQGNFDGQTAVSHVFREPILARYIRVVVQQFNSWPALRVELYSVSDESTDPGGQALGISTGKLAVSAFQASSAHGNNWNYYGPQFARLNQAVHYGGWIPQYNRAGEWIQVDLGKVQDIGAVATQGRAHGSYWVKSYTLTYSRNGNEWFSYGHSKGKTTTFTGNTDYWSVVKHEFPRPIRARWVRIIVNTFHGWPVLRWELYRPEVPSQRLGRPLGLSTLALPDSAIRASSAHGNNWHYYGPGNARLLANRNYGCWLPQYNRPGEWIQVDLGRVRAVGGVATQGRPAGSYWVRSYTLLYSTDGQQWTSYMSNGKAAAFSANSDYTTVESHVLTTPFLARFVRLVVRSYANGWPCMRFELLSGGEGFGSFFFFFFFFFCFLSRLHPIRGVKPGHDHSLEKSPPPYHMYSNCIPQVCAQRVC